MSQSSRVGLAWWSTTTEARSGADAADDVMVVALYDEQVDLRQDVLELDERTVMQRAGPLVTSKAPDHRWGVRMAI